MQLSEANSRDKKRREITMVDAFAISELNMLMVSYLVRQTHDSFIREISFYDADKLFDAGWYYAGGMIGMILTGPFLDKVMGGKKPYTVLVSFNFVLVFLDIYIFATASTEGATQTKNKTFSFFLGLFIAGTNLIYMILIPMMISRRYSLRLSQSF